MNYEKKFVNAEYGLEAIVSDRNPLYHSQHPYQVVLRDYEADATFDTRYGPLAYCLRQAYEFVNGQRYPLS
ncbi:MAG: hypothetical protein KGL39_19290 [Patescibacteria group bacterium]|nr:hypothetical protein [Patescibacteria group bacterium]